MLCFYVSGNACVCSHTAPFVKTVCRKVAVYGLAGNCGRLDIPLSPPDRPVVSHGTNDGYTCNAYATDNQRYTLYGRCRGYCKRSGKNPIVVGTCGDLDFWRYMRCSVSCSAALSLYEHGTPME